MRIDYILPNGLTYSILLDVAQYAEVGVSS